MIMSFISHRKIQANNRELLRLRMFIEGPRSYKADVCWLLPVSIFRTRGDFLFISQFQTRSLN